MHQDLLNDLINALTILPGVGKKSAQRMALYLLDRNKDGAAILANTMLDAIEHIGRCSRCRMLTSNNLCKVCSDTARENIQSEWQVFTDNFESWVGDSSVYDQENEVSTGCRILRADHFNDGSEYGVSTAFTEAE